MKSITTILLLAALLSACSACGSDAPAADANVGETTTAPDVTDDGLVHDNLGDIRFDGEQFTVWLAFEMPGYIMETETGDVFDDAVFARNRAVEERLGITLNYTLSGIGSSGAEQAQACSMIESYILAGDNTNDVYLHVQLSNIPQLINAGYFVDWNTIPNVDLTMPYWCQNALDDINYGSKVFMMTGLYEIGSMSSANCLIFNKRLLDEVQIAYPYQSVLDGTWTYDKWKEIITATTRDLNGDTQVDLTNDQYGYIGRLWEAPYTFFVGMGGDLIIKDKDNMPVNKITDEHNIDIMDRLAELATQTEGATITRTSKEMLTAFTGGRAATIHGALSFMPSYFRDMKDDFGFVPSPKYDESQKEYNVWIQAGAPMTYVPVTNSNLEMTGAVLEIMAMESYNHVIPAYFDTVLTIKSTRDTESEQMVPFIIERASFFDHTLNMLQLPYCLVDNVSLATYYAQNQSMVEEHLAQLTETYR